MRYIVLLTYISFIRAENIEYRYNGPPFPALNENVFTFSNNLESVIINHASIESIDINSFKNVPKLKFIDLSFNFISELPVGIFSHTPQLENLIIGSNNINGLKKNLFANLTFLKTVDFNHNHIFYVEENSFVNVPNLLSINLENNNLKSLQLNFIDDSKRIQNLYLGGNSWNCDQNLCELMRTAVSRFWVTPFAPECTNFPKTNFTTWKNVIDFSLPMIVTDIQPGISINKVHLQCHVCSNTKLMWQFDDVNITKNVFQQSKEYYTVSNLTKGGYMEGNYKCFALDNCFVPECSYGTTTIILQPATSATRIVVWSAGIIILLSAFVYYVFFYNKSRNSGENRSASLFSLIRKT